MGKLLLRQTGINMNEELDFVRGIVRSSGSKVELGRPPVCSVSCSSAPASFRLAGMNLLSAGRVAVVMGAGGASTRMGGTLRGQLAVGPVTGKSIFRLQAEKIMALRSRFCPDLRFLVLTSAVNHAATIRAFEDDGIAEGASFIEQSCLPIIDSRLAPVLSRLGSLVLAPTGHGGLISALREGGEIETLAAAGVDHLFFFQYPNVLELVCDPVMLGLHINSGNDVTLKGFWGFPEVASVGRVVETERGLRVVEYHYHKMVESVWGDFPANSGTYVISMNFLRRLIESGEHLPWHAVRVRLPGSSILHWKAEQFLFDILRAASQSGLVIAERQQEYAPVKNGGGEDSLDSARAALLRNYREWLARAGAKPIRIGALVEISPSFALDVDEVCQRIQPGMTYNDRMVFEG